MARQAVGLLALLVALAIAALTAYSVKSAGGIDVLTVASVVVVLLLAAAGIGALRGED